MNARFTRLASVSVSVLASITILAACSFATDGSSKGGTDMASMSDSAGSGTPSAKSTNFNDADVTFVQSMIPHHAQAVELSDSLLSKSGIAPKMTELANQIKDAQAPEIEKMNGMLTSWGKKPVRAGSMSGMDGMDGMVSPEDVQTFKDSAGVEAEKLFLTHMIAHHTGAIKMAQTEQASGKNPEAIALAKSVVSSQQAEVATMNSLLASL